MTHSDESDRFYALLTRKATSELIVEGSSNGPRLPVLNIPKHTRPAEQLTQAVEDRWGLRSYCLFTLPATHSSGCALSAAVLEIPSASDRTPTRMEWLSIASLIPGDLIDPPSESVIRDVLAELERYRSGQVRGPFARIGWFESVAHWVEQQAASLALRLDGTFKQLNASPTFSLVRFGTDGPALWFKAVGEPNLREYGITQYLASAFPEFLPKFVASRPDWNAWLSVEARGAHPGDCSDFRTWATAATDFATLQIASMGHPLHLLEAGCRDMRVPSLLALTESFFEVMAALMERQSTNPPAPLSQNELQALCREVERAIHRAADSGIPNTIGHLDFNPGNILVNADGCAFLDWAEACVGHPFLTFEYLKEHFRKLSGATQEEVRTLTAAYAAPWHQILSAETLESNLELTPLLAAFAYAVSLDWQDPENISPTTAVYLRSLARRMQREADLLRDRRILCAR